MTEKKDKAEKAAPQLLRRIDRNSVIGDKAAVLKMVMQDTNATHHLYRVGGICIGVIRGESAFGEWIKLAGRFRAINYRGEEFTSGAAFLPPDLASMIAENMSKGDKEQLQFLFDVFVRYDDKLATSYGYIVEPVREAGVADPLDALFANAGQLSAPENKALLEGPKTDKK